MDVNDTHCRLEEFGGDVQVVEVSALHVSASYFSKLILFRVYFNKAILGNYQENGFHFS